MKKFISVLLCAIIALSALTFSVFAADEVGFDMSGGLENLNNTVNGTVEGDRAIIDVFKLGDNLTESAKILLDYYNKNNPTGIIVNLDDDLNELELYLGETSVGDLLSAIFTVVNDDDREAQPITLQKGSGSAMFDVKTLEQCGKYIESSSFDHLESVEEIIDAFNDIKDTKVIAVFEVIPYSELKEGDITPAQNQALENAISATAQTLYVVKSKLYIQKGNELIEMTENPGIITNTVHDVYSYSNGDDETDIGSKYVLHISPDGQTLTNIAGKERLYDSLVFSTHLMGEFFIVDSPDSVPVAQNEPDAPEPLPYYYFAKLDTDNLTDAVASLDKSKDLLQTDKITLTVRPNPGKKFVTAPEVKVKQINLADVGTPVLQADGSYTFEITNFKTNVTLEISGSAVVNSATPVASIKIISLPNKLQYGWKESFNPDGLVINAYYADGTSAGIVDNSAITFTGFSTSKNGEKTITANYDGYTATFKIEVNFTFWNWLLYIICFGWIWM